MRTRLLAIALAVASAAWGPAPAAEDEAAALPAPVPASLPGARPFPAELRRALAEALASRGSDYTPRTRHRRADGGPVYTNRLLLEPSPYLQQHAHNPVDWRPWGDAAFEEAAALGRPVLVSIGYSTCHWCHVMEEESFDDPEVARLLNRHFIAIKVDREARPDVDAVYMAAIQAMSGNGGWPLNVWVTPDREPFYAGTYFPREERAGRPSFPAVLRQLHEIYAESPERVEVLAERVSAAVRQALAGGAPLQATRVPGPEALRRAAETYAASADRTWGGIGEGHKFPASIGLRFLLRYHRGSGDDESLALASLTLEKMAAGGLYDHVGGGFHRYATDARWLVPHFEKMLYDNARLAQAYLEAWQATGRDDFARVARETLDYLIRDMGAPGGCFFSATDADSPPPGGEAGEREEGRFFTWTPAEIDAVLGPERGALVRAYYGVTEEGHLEGRSILHTWRSAEEVAAERGTTAERVREVVSAARGPLRAAREERPHPERDEKILVAWNGLAISALARAGFAFDEPAYTGRAARCADFLLREQRGEDGRLSRVHKDGQAFGPAFLTDYAFLIAGLLDLYEARAEPRWLREALALQSVLDAHYADAQGGGYFQTADDHETLLAREKPSQDGAIPSGNSVAALNLLRLHDLTTRDALLEHANLLFTAFHDTLSGRPTALPTMLLALDYHLDAAKEILVVGPSQSGDGAEAGLAAMLSPLRTAFVPNRVVSVASEGEGLRAHAALVPPLEGKRARGGEVTAYVCRNRVCSLPTTDAQVFAEQLAESEPLPAGDGEAPEPRQAP